MVGIDAPIASLAVTGSGDGLLLGGHAFQAQTGPLLGVGVGGFVAERSSDVTSPTRRWELSLGEQVYFVRLAVERDAIDRSFRIAGIATGDAPRGFSVIGTGGGDEPSPFVARLER